MGILLLLLSPSARSCGDWIDICRGFRIREENEDSGSTMTGVRVDDFWFKPPSNPIFRDNGGSGNDINLVLICLHHYVALFARTHEV